MLPNPTDAFTNPVRYWTDVLVLQLSISRQVYESASLINPFLPRIDFGASVAGSPAPIRPAPGRAPKRPAALKTDARVAKRAAPKATADASTKSAPNPKTKGRPVTKPAAMKKVAKKAAATPDKEAPKVASNSARNPEVKARVEPAAKPSTKHRTVSAPSAHKPVAAAKPKSPASRGTTRKTKVTLAPDLPPSAITGDV